MSKTMKVTEFVADMHRLAQTFGKDQRPALKRCMPLVKGRVERNFDQGQTAAGVKWPPHAPYTVKKYGEHPLLILSGKLQGASTGENDTSGGHIEMIDGKTELRFGLDSSKVLSKSGGEYAPTHQLGDIERNIPQREFMAVSEDTVDGCVNAVADEAVKELGRLQQ